MDKKIVMITALLLWGITAYFSYAYFSAGGSVTRLVSPSKQYQTPLGNGVSEEELTGPANEECPINGKMLTKGHKRLWESRRPLGVMIENHTDARPQSGLSSADVVYEAVAEGGITRFLAIFYCQDAKYIGPVRSARMYFINMLQGYGKNPLYAHVGGANTPGPADALGYLRKKGWDGYNDLNQFSIAFPYYYRDYERNPGVATEHTMYSSTQKLWDFAAKKRDLTDKDEDGDSWDDNFSPWEFKDDEKSSGSVSSIAYDFWDNRPAFGVSWSYDATTNSYTRSHKQGGPHIDKNTGKAITAKNVVVVFMKESPARDGYSGGHLLYGTIGTGKAIVFQDGASIEGGTWSKKDEESTITFKDSSGKEISLNRGLTWISILPTGNEVEF